MEELTREAVRLDRAGRVTESAKVLERALVTQVRMLEAKLGRNHRAVADAIHSLAVTYSNAERHGDAESMYRQVIAILENTPGTDPRDRAIVLDNLAGAYRGLGRYAEAKQARHRAVTIFETGPPRRDDLDLATALNNLAGLYHFERQYTIAERLYERALGITKTAPGGTIFYGNGLDNLAGLYMAQGRYPEAESLQRRALAVLVPELGRDHIEVATVLNNLALALASQQRYAEAEQAFREGLRINESARGKDHPAVATGLFNLALVQERQGQRTEAEAGFRRALRIDEKAFGQDHPVVGRVTGHLAALLAEQDQITLARALFERARRIQLSVRRLNDDLDDAGIGGLFQTDRGSLRAYVALLAKVARDHPAGSGRASVIRDAFIASEQIRDGSAQRALARAAARGSVSDPAIGQLLRHAQELRQRRHAIERRIAREYGRSTANRATTVLDTLRAGAQRLDDEIAAVTADLAKRFPRFNDLAAAPPIDPDGVERVLHPDEALLSYLVLRDRVLVWLIRREHPTRYWDVEVDRARLGSLIARVRASMDQRENALPSPVNLHPFDVAGAHELHQLLVAPVVSHLAGVAHVIVVPDEAMFALPMGVLVTESTGAAYRTLAALHARGRPPTSQEMALYGQLPWLGRKYAMSVLPSATSLRVLRESAESDAAAGEPFVGFGDPELERFATEPARTLLKQRGVAAERLARLGRLGGAEQTLGALAAMLGADRTRAVYVRERATKSLIFELNRAGRLRAARILAFATHGLIAGEVEGLSQPALVLTPLHSPAGLDDGLLNLDDILGLRLDSAGWIVLAACNTAAPDGTGEALSGLARAFFFAARRPALLISHWTVESQATQTLVTEVLSQYARDPTVTRAQALQRGMLAVLNRGADRLDYLAHPFAWASFFLTGEGG